MPPGRSTATDADPRIQGFLGVTIAHPHLKRAENDLRLRIRQPAGAALVLLCGPTGVGKTTLIERTIRETNRELLPTLEADPDRLGIVSLRVMASEVSTFSWRDLYLRTLHALAEPFAGDVPAGMITEKELQSMKRQRATVADVRERLISVLRVRRPAAVVWDESQHIALNLRPVHVVQQMEIMKSLANESGVLILAGTYDLVRLRNLNGQLSRRSHDIHFPRYRAEDPREREIFDAFVRQLISRVPMATVGLEKRLDDIYARTLGCVGNLKGWLTLALAHALAQDHRRLEWRHLQETGKSKDQVMQMAMEIAGGEQTYADEDLSLEDVQKLLLPGSPMDRTPPGRRESSRRRRPGERNPARDPAGRGAIAEFIGVP